MTAEPGQVTLATADVLRMLAGEGITHRKLDHWTHTGAIRPLVAVKGSGRPRTWDTGEVAVMRALSRLKRAGLDHLVAVRLARNPPRADETTEVRLTDHVTVVLSPNLWK